MSQYGPHPSWRVSRDPIRMLPGGDELAAELADAIGHRFEHHGERHVHPKRGGCPTCAAAAADTVVRYLEANTRVIHSEALAPEEFDRARRAIRAVPYLNGNRRLRLKGDLGADPDHPTVDDLLGDLDTISAAVVDLLALDREREGELRRYREWRKAVQGLATDVVDMLPPLDPRAGDVADTPEEHTRQ